MFIHEMTDEECRSALEKASIGRLGCALDNKPYVVPINFAFDGHYIYGFSTLGQKVEWMRANPSVCFELDETISHNQWMSIIVIGRYEELPDAPGYQRGRSQAHSALQKRAMWWEPAYISQAHRDQQHSLTPIFYRIHIEKMTGHRATPDRSEKCAAAAARAVQRGWLDRLLHH